VLILPWSPGGAIPCGEIQTHARLSGRSCPVNDAWISAGYLARQLPRITLNVRDCADLAEREGLEVLLAIFITEGR